METRSAVSNPYTLMVNQNFSVSASIDVDGYTGRYQFVNALEIDHIPGSPIPNERYLRGYIENYACKSDQQTMVNSCGYRITHLSMGDDHASLVIEEASSNHVEAKKKIVITGVRESDGLSRQETFYKDTWQGKTIWYETLAYSSDPSPLLDLLPPVSSGYQHTYEWIKITLQFFDA